MVKKGVSSSVQTCFGDQAYSFLESEQLATTTRLGIAVLVGFARDQRAFYLAST